MKRFVFLLLLTTECQARVQLFGNQGFVNAGDVAGLTLFIAKNCGDLRTVKHDPEYKAFQLKLPLNTEYAEYAEQVEHEFNRMSMTRGIQATCEYIAREKFVQGFRLR